ncbi:hypothetical protein HPB52_001954 [Rhipicephalus sanguineus]|uniref:Endonuclease/exonuclease/phosphatase domain-containing protein n=1 Tax=Rhipicephalus sanguineus TaxID=34632 RepID=A0A9D4PWF7_RHISA|nr:hypothetical protein HPB52_001954 [Rhipicephalus sanguineus]
MCGHAAPCAPQLDKTPTTPPEYCFARRSHRADLIGKKRRQHRDHGRRPGGQVPDLLLWRSRQRYRQPQRIHEERRWRYARDDVSMACSLFVIDKTRERFIVIAMSTLLLLISLTLFGILFTLLSEDSSRESVTQDFSHGHVSHTNPSSAKTDPGTLHRLLDSEEHKIEGTTVEHTIVEVIPERKSQQSLYVTDVYSPPRDQLTDYDHFIREVRKRTRGHRLVVVGDFNAPQTAWGYAITTKKGARVHDVAQQHGLTLWNDPLQPTRTNPDHTFPRDVKKAGWTCLPETLGSDHHIIQLDIGYERRPTKTGTARLTDWNAFRNELDDDEAIADIDAWPTKHQTRASPSTGCKCRRAPRFEYLACTCTATDQGPPRFLDFNRRFSNSRTS